MLGHVIFLGIFFAVLCVLCTTVALSFFRTNRDFRKSHAEAICWKSGFADLPLRERVCRHVFTGEFKDRICDKAFDCRTCGTHAALVAKHPVTGEQNRFYHRGHAWAQPEADGTVTIGLDDLATRMVAHPESVELPAVGTHLQANAAAWHMRKRGADVRILSPIDGEVVAGGGTDDGWYLKVRPDGGMFDARHLLRGDEIQPWLTREMDRLHLVLAPEGAAPTMADGGEPVDDIAAAHPEADWDAVCAELFLEP